MDGVGDEELSVGARQQVARIAAGQQPGTARSRRLSPHPPARSLVSLMRRRSEFGPASPNRRVGERRPACNVGDPCPVGERLGGRGAADLEVASRELDARRRVEIRRGHGPNRRPARALPANPEPSRSARRTGDCPGGRRALHRPRRYSTLRPPRYASSRAARSSARSWIFAVVRHPGQRVHRVIAGRHDVRRVSRPPRPGPAPGPPRSPVPSSSTRACSACSAERGTLSCRPAHAACGYEAVPGGSRSSRAWTPRRYARI